MEFWGVNVSAGKPSIVQPERGKLVHISQVALGKVNNKKMDKSVHLSLKINGENYIIGSLSAEGRSQMMLDLVFQKEFELSHDWKDGIVSFIGYTTNNDAVNVVRGDDFVGNSDDSESADDLLGNSSDARPMDSDNSEDSRDSGDSSDA